MEMRNVESSNISAAAYDPDTKVLRVRFSSGAEYDYLDVPEVLGQDFFEAESIGKFFYGAIKSSFECKKVEVKDVDEG